jgi:hypothetical protein
MEKVPMREAIKRNMASLEVSSVCCMKPMFYVEPTATALS